MNRRLEDRVLEKVDRQREVVCVREPPPEESSAPESKNDRLWRRFLAGLEPVR